MFKLPLVKKQEIRLEDVKLIGYDKVKEEVFYMENEFDWLEDCYQTYYDDWLKNRTFRKSAWIGDSHTHCLFDAKRISNYDIEDNDKQGYLSSNDRTWICSSCFEEIQKRHSLPIIKNTVKMVKDALTDNKTVVFSLKNEQYIIRNNAGVITVEHDNFVKEYENLLSMECEHLFYGKQLRDIIDEIFIGVI